MHPPVCVMVTAVTQSSAAHAVHVTCLITGMAVVEGACRRHHYQRRHKITLLLKLES